MRVTKQAFASVMAVVGILLTISLGVWQTRRADEKLVLQAQWEAAEQAAPHRVAGSDLAAIAQSLPRRVVLHGVWLHEHEVWLDNRSLAGVAGFHLIAPLRLQDGGVVLVNRGFAPRDPLDRTRLPAVQRPTGEVDIGGIALAQASRVLELGPEGPGDSGPPSRIWQNLDYARFERETGLKVGRFVVQQRDGADEALRRDWPSVASGIERHRGYAFQWFALAALIAMLLGTLAIRPWWRRRSAATRP